MLRLLSLLALLLCAVLPLTTTPAAETEPVIILVTDPLAADNSCPCVAGYGQRDYAKLGTYLAKTIGRDVKVYFAESLAGLKKQTKATPAFIIGKDSVLRHQAGEAGLKPAPLAALTGLDGKTTQTGLLVVADKDAAVVVGDLKDYEIYFGPEYADEKYQAILALLGDFKIAIPEKKETCLTCSVAATKTLDQAKMGKKVAGIISNYAKPLLEGCGTVKKGELRVVGETEPVPFIVAFATDAAEPALREKVKMALFSIGTDAPLCKAMETRGGFVTIPSGKGEAGKKN